MSALPDDRISEEEWAEEQNAISHLKHFIEMAVNDGSTKKRIKIAYVGASFFGDYYISPTTLQKALK